MHTWYWKTWQDRSYLACSVLESFSHGFFTQTFSPQAPEELTAALDDSATVFRIKQVHGNAVLSASEHQSLTENQPVRAEHPLSSIDDMQFPHADGLLTNEPQQAIWVCTADCVPVLIADVGSGQVAAVHAGWRGTAQQIVPEAIARLQAQGAQIEDLRVAMGPAIAGEVYQVSTQVAAEVGATVLDLAADAEPDDILTVLEDLPGSPLLPDPQPGRVRLDVRRVNELQLMKLGLNGDQIAIAPFCTYQMPEYFFSYRRDRLKKVQWSGIVSLSA